MDTHQCLEEEEVVEGEGDEEDQEIMDLPFVTIANNLVTLLVIAPKTDLNFIIINICFL